LRKTINKPFVGLLALLFFGSELPAQNLGNSFLHYSLTEGLPSAEVYQIFQDKAGFIWFATDNGVVRFDGQSMVTYQGREGLPDPVIFGFFEDYKDRLWFRSYSGRLSYYEKDTIVKYGWNEKLIEYCKSDLLLSISVDSLDGLWFTTNNFTGKISADGNISYQPPDSVHFDFWQAGNEHSVRWHGQKYVSFGNILYAIHGNEMHRVFRAHDTIISLSVDLNENLWIGYLHDDCERYSVPDFKNPVVPEFLKGRGVTSVLQDRQAGYWISTLKNGVYYIPNSSFTRYDLPSARSKLKTGNGPLLIADDNDQLMVINPKTMAVKEKKTLLAPVIAAVADRRKNFWVATQKNLVIYDAALREKTSLPLVVKSFTINRDHIYSLTNSRVIKFDSNGTVVRFFELQKIHRSIISTPPWFILPARTGFDVYDSSFNLVATPPQFEDLKISGISNLNDSTLLVATTGSGFFIVSKNDWSSKQYVNNDKFIADNIYATLIVNGMLWLATEKGIAVTPLKLLLHDQPAFKLITHSGGLVEDRVEMLQSIDENILAFSGNSICVIPSDIHKINFSETLFNVSQIRVGNKPAVSGETLQLPASPNELRIDFGFINFTNPNIYIRSRLSKGGLWVFSTSRTLIYDNLAAGHYSLELEYSLNSMQWTPAKIKLEFSVAAPWYQRLYFHVLLILVVLLASYSFFRFRLSVLQEKNLRLQLTNDHRKHLLQAEIDTMERERSRIAKDLHDGVGMGLTVLKLKLYQLFKPVRKIPTDLFDSNETNEVLNQINSTIADIRDTIHNLTPSGLQHLGLSSALRTYVEKKVADLDVRFELHESGTSVKEPRIGLACFRILQELTSNSLKHSSATEISVYISTFENMITIFYKDNGQGFTSNPVSTGTGLLNIEARLDQLQGTMDFRSGDFGVSYTFTIPFYE
jgi:signal transduction histidine kinase/ligand-binding sensor domain-containing protein